MITTAVELEIERPAESLVEAIRRRYPKPGMAKDSQAQYCVLGAAIQYFALSMLCDFPPSVHAAHLLGISEDDAKAITKVNDMGDFERAWALLGQALAARQPVDEIEDGTGRV